MGRGQWYRWNTKETVESCRQLDVRKWQREGLLKPGTWFSTTWSDSGGRHASIGVQVIADLVTLRYRYRRGDATDWQDVTEPIRLTWTPCHYGGRRPWFICPGSKNGIPCGRRVAKLYDGGRFFLCRSCFNLTYASRRERTGDRALGQAQAIRRRLGGGANMFEPFPDKPPRMWWRTYDRLRQVHDDAEDRHHAWFLRWLERTQEQIDRLTSQSTK